MVLCVYVLGRGGDDFLKDLDPLLTPQCMSHRSELSFQYINLNSCQASSRFQV